MGIRVLLADDHRLVRAGLRAVVEQFPDVTEVIEASDGREALAAVAQAMPDIVLLDIAMPSLNGLDACAQIVRDFPQSKVIMLSSHGSEPYVLQALRSGATGYLLKDAAVTELSMAMAAALRGELYITSAVSRQVVSRFLAGGGEESPLHQLTARQREILQLIAEGQSTKEIAHLLNLSAKTVETHRRQLMERLDIHDVPGLVRFAVRIGLVETR
jgi:DNA-binding NarL/FixJ family response regulator